MCCVVQVSAYTISIPGPGTIVRIVAASEERLLRLREACRFQAALAALR
jgi:hypothetical protein